MDFRTLFTEDTLKNLFPFGRTDTFFEALYGDAAEGAYDICLAYAGGETGELKFEFQLVQRAGKCLACNLTYGLPQVFSKHPVIDVNGLVVAIDQLLGENIHCREWKLGRTLEISRRRHVIPLSIFYDQE